MEMKRRAFISAAAGALVAGADTTPAQEGRNPVIEKIDQWEEATNQVTSKMYGKYLRDGKTHGFMPLEVLESGFEKVMREVKETKVGSVPAVWSVYNMGYIVKTPKAVFSIDLVHRRAEEFAPLLDFMLVTHNHGDHFHQGLYGIMNRAGKMVISNFLDNYGVWQHCGRMVGGYTRAAKEFCLKDVRIRTSLIDHNDYLIDFTTAFEIKVGDFIIYHTGDSGLGTEPKLQTTWGHPDLWLFFPGCGIDVAKAVSRVKPKRIVFGHLWELGHSHGRLKAPQIKRSLAAAAPHCSNVAPMFWGDRIA